MKASGFSSVRRIAFTILSAAILSAAAPVSSADDTWRVALGEGARESRAVQLALEDLRAAGERLGVRFVDDDSADGPILAVGGPDGNAVTAALAAGERVVFEGVDHPEGFEIRPIQGGSGGLAIAGDTPLGEVYGLYWLCDRMLASGAMPELDVKRAPRLQARLGPAENVAAMRNALRYGMNWVVGNNTLHLIPWGVEPEDTENREHRAHTEGLIQQAHDLHLKYLVNSDEFTFHPAMQEAFGAELHPGDEGLWRMLQAQYRQLFELLPGIDGVVIRSGELTRVTGDYEAYNVMHHPADPDWPLERRYRTFIQRLHETVVGEFDKIYFHRTWVTNTTEQHSRPDVFKAIFTDDVPTRNLYLSPYITRADRWLYQPYNPTFNLTPHNMVVLLPPMDYHANAGVDVFPIYPGPYFHEGMQRYLAPENSNLVGVQGNLPGGRPADPSQWDTTNLTAYTVFRLSWDPGDDPRQIAEDFAAIHLGPESAELMGEALMISEDVYKHGVYVKPVAEGVEGNKLPHLRLTTFPLQGVPAIDSGREHLRWLRQTLYEPSKDRLDEAIEYLDHGRALARRLHALTEEAQPLVADEDLAEYVVNGANLTRLLVETTNLYVKTCFAYFDYWEVPEAGNRDTLAEYTGALKNTLAEFAAAPGYVYNPFGIDQLAVNAEALLADYGEARARIHNAPAADDVQGLIEEQQRLHQEAFEAHKDDAIPLLRWRGRVDGIDILHIQGESIEIEHFQYDPIHSIEYEFAAPVPEEEITVLLRDIQSAPIHPVIIEQPGPENDYTVKVYLDDAPPGYNLWEFELYYLPLPPEDVGLAIPWR